MSSIPGDFGGFARGKIFFTADDGPDGREVWITRRHWRQDPADEGRFAAVSVRHAPTWLAANGGDRLYFVQYGPVGGVRADSRDGGTSRGAVMVADHSDPDRSAACPRVPRDGERSAAFFQALRARNREAALEERLAHGRGACGSAITSSATASSGPSLLTEVGGRYFFGADDGIHGAELWKPDGTAAGTVFREGHQSGVVSREDTVFLSFADVNGTAFFLAWPDWRPSRRRFALLSYELWKSDGTESGDSSACDRHPVGSSSGPIDPFLLRRERARWSSRGRGRREAAASCGRSDGTSAGF